MIGLGTALIQRFSWMLYVFGVILILTAFKMLLIGDSRAGPRSTIRSSSSYEGAGSGSRTN